jgi:hypothetical protein
VRDLFKVRKVTGIRCRHILRFCVNLLVSSDFHKYMRRTKRAARRKCHDGKLGGWIEVPSAALIYAIIRSTRPDVVVETGVGPGGTTAFILLALHHNRRGKLYSIDLPGNDATVYPALGKPFNLHVPPGLGPGWLVPPWLTDRWVLIIGDSREHLLPTLQRIGPVDLFLHDSLHTDDQVFFEFQTTLPHMKRRGILLCDDVKRRWSLAFLKFCETKRVPHLCFNRRLGVASLPDECPLD